MNAFIQLTITEKPEFVFQNDLMDKVKKEYSGYLVFDFDNHSEGYLKEYVSRLITECSVVVLFVEIKHEPSLNKMLPYLEKVISAHPKVFWFINGENVFLKRLFSIYKKEFELLDSNQKITSFLPNLFRDV